MSEQQPRPMPKPVLPPSEITRFYWDAAREHRLVLQRCDDCAYYIHWPSVRCPRCGSARLGEAEVSGRGRIYTYTVVHHVFMPQFAGDIPYVLALVELEEQPGLRMLTNIVDCAPDAIEIGMPVEVTFEDRDGVSLPQFRPAEGARA